VKVYLGNSDPHDQGEVVPGPTLTICTIEDSAGYVVGSDAMEVKEHLFDNPGLVTHLPGNEAILNIIRSWPDHGNERPTFVKVEAEGRNPEEADDLERFLSDFYHCPRDYPEDLEQTYHTLNGPPGVGGE
jgi:hypothetical protein